MTKFQFIQAKMAQVTMDLTLKKKNSKVLAIIFFFFEILKKMIQVKYFIRMYRPVQVEPAKSNKSKCKTCKKIIEKDELRAKVVDDRAFQEYIRENGGRQNISCEGLYRGYFQTEHGTISIDKYFVHLRCYRPIHPHPKTAEYFKLVGSKTAHRQLFKKWLEAQEQKIQEKEKKNNPSKTKPIKKRRKKKQDDDESY